MRKNKSHFDRTILSANLILSVFYVGWDDNICLIPQMNRFFLFFFIFMNSFGPIRCDQSNNRVQSMNNVNNNSKWNQPNQTKTTHQRWLQSIFDVTKLIEVIVSTLPYHYREMMFLFQWKHFFLYFSAVVLDVTYTITVKHKRSKSQESNQFRFYRVCILLNSMFTMSFRFHRTNTMMIREMLLANLNFRSNFFICVIFFNIDVFLEKIEKENQVKLKWMIVSATTIIHLFWLLSRRWRNTSKILISFSLFLLFPSITRHPFDIVPILLLITRISLMQRIICKIRNKTKLLNGVYATSSRFTHRHTFILHTHLSYFHRAQVNFSLERQKLTMNIKCARCARTHTIK